MRGAGPAAAIGGLLTVLGSVLPWVRARGSRPELDLTSTAASSLGTFTYGTTDRFPSSTAMVVLVAGLLTAVVAMLRSWLLTVVTSMVALSVAGLWLGLASAAFEGVDLPWNDFRPGAYLVIGGALVALLMGLSLRPRSSADEE